MSPLHRVEAEKARAAAQAHDDAHSQVQDEVSRILSVERAVAHESLQQAVMRERISTEDEKLRAQLYHLPTVAPDGSSHPEHFSFRPPPHLDSSPRQADYQYPATKSPSN
ncbi:hypothetical protein EYF80_040405 [Liparis tanakae]|uniref:Uncharacterized protein n=1 Tax=Liparis tanakae TaxID=230148 RepID=A0A4Z2G8W8_9TELE|nr:hypothetical protein EYF80_040405 [Liparis tanakae]